MIDRKRGTIRKPVRELSYRRAFCGFEGRVRELITANGHEKVCDLGGGRSPLLSPEEAQALGISYTVCDVSRRELELGPAGHDKLLLDISTPLAAEGRKGFDLIFSRFVAEHVSDGRILHQNVYEMLRPGGQAFHLFPTLYHPAFVLNRLMPHGLMDRARNLLIGRAYAKFPAVYSWCFGPSARRTAALSALGYDVEEYLGFYGTPYLRRVPLVGRLDVSIDELLARRRSRLFTSYASVLLRKPTGRP